MAGGAGFPLVMGARRSEAGGEERTWARSCLRRGEADARITRLPRRLFRAGRLRGRGARSTGLAGAPAWFGECAAVSYDGGGSVGARAYLLSAILEESASHHRLWIQWTVAEERINDCPKEMPRHGALMSLVRDTTRGQSLF